MVDWKTALPVIFEYPKNRVYRAEIKGPPLYTREILPHEFPTNSSSVMIELEDCEKIGATMVSKLLGEKIEAPNHTLLLALQPQDARHLLCALVNALADGGDMVASKISDYIHVALEEAKMEEGCDEEDN